MAEYKPKLKDVALAAQTAGRQAEHAIDGVRELREKITNIEKHIAVIDDKVFKKINFVADGEGTICEKETYYATNDSIVKVKLDNCIHIELATFAKNKCPHCGSHNLHFTFDPDAFSDSTVNCRDCHNSWKIGGCAEDIDSPYEVANILRSENRTLFEENKRLQEENEKLKKQAAIDMSYMVTVEDLMSRLKSREERIEALKQENNKLESENEQLKNKNKELDKYIDKYFKDLTPNQLRACDIMAYELNEIEKENDQLKKDVDNLKTANEDLRKDIIRHINEKTDAHLSNLQLNEQCAKMADKIDRFKKEIAAYRDEKYEFSLAKKALNIYQDITELDVSINRNVGFIRLTDSDAAGRAVVKNSDLDALCDAYCKYHTYCKKEK